MSRLRMALLGGAALIGAGGIYTLTPLTSRRRQVWGDGHDGRASPRGLAGKRGQSPGFLRRPASPYRLLIRRLKLHGHRHHADEAYRFARGLPINYLGQVVRRPRPLDFMAVTDHSEFMGTLNQLDDPESSLSKSDVGKLFHENPLGAFMKIFIAGNAHQDLPGLNAGPAEASAMETRKWRRPTRTTSRARSRPSSPMNGHRCRS